MQSVAKQVETQALAALVRHPLHAEATGWAYCASDVYEQPKSFVDRLRLAEEDKERIQMGLRDVEAVLVVSFWASERKPEPLSGAGKHYAFFLHPQTFEVLHSGVGAWRA
ncbi:hypothetical protein ACG04Q_00620 [Roseateles sp. DXS20W]|uniref:Uncharacterized protein n=1 Tax=Pelomonas lactea TaxID=3299030 RepID=A0ABW7GDW7_9BURK